MRGAMWAVTAGLLALALVVGASGRGDAFRLSNCDDTKTKHPIVTNALPEAAARLADLDRRRVEALDRIAAEPAATR